MAEFCLDCWNKMNRIQLEEKDVVLSDDLDLCEECAQVKPVIVTIGKRRRRKKKLIFLDPPPRLW